MIKKTSTPSTAPECGCAFIGGTYLTTPYLGDNDKIKGVGTGDFKMAFDFTGYQENNETIFGPVRVTNGGYIGIWVMGELILSSLTPMEIGTKYSISVERISGVTTIKINGIVDVSGDDGSDWSQFDTWAIDANYWKFFYDTYTENYHCFRISNFKFWKAGELIIDLPLISDTTEKQNSLPMTTVERLFPLFFCNGYGRITDSSQLNSMYNVGGSWGLLASAAGVGNFPAFYINKVGCNMHFPAELESKYSITEAYLYASCNFDDVGVRGNVSAYKNNTPSAIASLADYQNHFSDITEKSSFEITYSDDIFMSPDLAAKMNDVLEVGSMNGLQLFIEDHDGNSDAGKGLLFDFNSSKFPFILFNYR